MKDILIRTSTSAVTMIGKPEEIRAIIAGWTETYGRDMPLAYILQLKAEPRIYPPKAG